MKMNTACFIGHREINETEELKSKLCEIIEALIAQKQINTFLFGSKSRFNDLCYELVTKINEKYPYIKRVYVRAEFPYIDEAYTNYLLKNYEETYYPEKISDARRTVYVKRNYHMIDKSQFCIVYYHNDNLPIKRKSGTKIALDYAIKKNKEIILLP